MVWGVKFDTEFNEFNPAGDFRGYREAMAEHYGAEKRPGLTPKHAPNFVFTADRPVDSDSSPYTAFSTYKLDVSDKFHSEIGVPRAHKPALLPVLQHEWPTEYVYEKTYKRHASFVEFPNRMYAVDEALRDVIEGLEPGVHQFNPIKVFLPKGVEHPVRFHMMIVRRWLNSLSVEHSEPGCLLEAEKTSPLIRRTDKASFAGVAMLQSVIGAAHIWRERGLRGVDFLMSDALMAEIDKAGLQVPMHYKMKSVSVVVH